MSLFITGTDTGVGKTYLAVQLLRLLRNRGLRCTGFKPICCGDRRDAELLLGSSTEGVAIDELNPLWLRTPAAPLTASRLENVVIEPERLLDAFKEMRRRYDFLVVEGVGGWRVPITQDYFVSDLAGRMDLPVLVVVQNKLGCLNHTLLTLESIEAQGLKIAGVVLSSYASGVDVASTTNAEILGQITEHPILPPLTEKSVELPMNWCQTLAI